ncbi:MAG: T9SS type A sorting domain-containing protein [Ignavibacteriaceae bacterium]
MNNKLLFIPFTFLFSILIQSQNPEYSWRYYTTGNTGIQGDYVEAIWIDHDGDPYIAAYTPGWEEGGFAKYIQSENKWINYSNIDYPVIGDINDVGSSRISDIEEDANGILWMATWRGILKFDPAIGASSLEFFGVNNSLHPGGRTSDIAIAPDGSIWATVISVVWGGGGLVNYNPTTNQWRYWYYGSNANNWPSLIGYCEKVSIQEKTAGGYIVWVDGEGWNTMITFDSDTQLFTLLPQNGDAGEVVSLSGIDNVDAQNNLWAIRQSSTPGIFSLDYKTPDGSWITPTQPSVSLTNDIWSFKAYGNGKAILIDGNSNVWQFNTNAWINLGVWREGGFSYGVDIDANGNIWVTGIGGAAKRDAVSGQWQRHRITNSSQIDYWVNDISIDDQGNVWMTGNAGPGVGGIQLFDGTRWTGFNESTYGLGNPFPFPTDNTETIYYRPSTGAVIINPMFNSLHSWNGINYSSLNYSNSRSQGLVEDSQNRLWSLGEYFDLSYYNDAGNNWIDVPFLGITTNITKDPQRSGTIWACSFYQVLRTDGSYNFSKVVDDFSELDPQSDVLTTVVPIQDGFAWVGTNQGLAKVNANNGTYQFYSPTNSQIPGENISPLAVTPDGRLWFANFQSTTTSTYGLCWFDGTDFGIIPQQQIGGLPHAQIYDLEVKNIQNGYELWISCASRGIAVLTVTGSVVPVELVSFSASSNGNNVNLNWSTATEINNSGFSIERKQVFNHQSSVSNEEWTMLSFINGHGTTTETQSYSFTDDNLVSGKYLYRLKQIDFDGTFEYSNEVEVIINVPEKFELLQNYPNPFNPSTKIKYQIADSNPVSLKIYDVLGNEVVSLVNEVQSSGNYEVTFDASMLSSGTYFYKLQSGSLVETKKMILIK